MKLRATHTSFVILCLFLWLADPGSRLQAQSSTQEEPAQVNNTSQQSAPSPNAGDQNAGPAPAQDVAPSSNSVTPAEKTATPKPPVLRHRKRKTAKKANSTTQKLPDGSSKTVVKNGGTSDKSAQLSPAVAPEQAQHQRISTEELLAATDANLKRVAARELNSEQQGTLEQIHTYMRQAKAASAAGDTNRAQTLAYKARLLSDDLAHK